MNDKIYSIMRTVLFGVITQRSGNFLPMFRDNLSVSSSRVENQKQRLTGSPEMPVRIHHYSLRNNPEKRGSRLLRKPEIKHTVPLCCKICSFKSIVFKLCAIIVYFNPC